MRKVIVSGGTRGIGLACVKKFCECGDRVAFIYKNSHDLAKQISREYGAFAICADLSNPDEAKRATSEAIDALNGVDTLVNNAGISYVGLFTDMMTREWRDVIDTNLSSAFFLSQCVAKEMIRNQHGKIVNIGSVWGRVGASCEVAYSASKAGLRGLTLSLAKELGPSGITVNCVEPGVIDTDMNKCFDEITLSELKEETPLGRIGQTSDVANAVEFLASEKADFVTGQFLGVNGGFSL